MDSRRFGNLCNDGRRSAHLRRIPLADHHVAGNYLSCVLAATSRCYFNRSYTETVPLLFWLGIALFAVGLIVRGSAKRA